jgi:bacteriochlorophyllide a dehydrogenase
MATKVKAIVFEKAQKATVGEFELPPMQDDHLFIETLYTFVSSGTELRVYAGHYGADKNFPLIPGYAGVGRILKTGAKVKGYAEGDLVSFCPDHEPYSKPVGINAQWGGQASHQLLPASIQPVILPVGCNPLDYVFSQVAAISLRGVLAACPQPGETAIVIGQGAIGAFSAAWLVQHGCRVIVADVVDYRMERALQFGVQATVNSGRPDAIERLRMLCDRGADIVVESSGVPAGVRLANALVRRTPERFRDRIREVRGDWPRIVYQANYLQPMQVEPQSEFPGEGVIILCPADRGNEDRIETVAAIKEGKLKQSHFVDAVVPYTEAAATYEKLRLHPEQLFSVAYSWKK